MNVPKCKLAEEWINKLHIFKIKCFIIEKYS